MSFGEIGGQHQLLDKRQHFPYFVFQILQKLNLNLLILSLSTHQGLGERHKVRYVTLLWSIVKESVVEHDKERSPRQDGDADGRQRMPFRYQEGHRPQQHL